MTKYQIKLYRSLHHAQGRAEAGQFLVEGPQLVQEALNEKWPLTEVLWTREFAAEEQGESLLRWLREAGVEPQFCSPAEMSRAAEAVTPQGVMALAQLPTERVSTIEQLRPEILLTAEEVSDPGNLGTLLRTADWFGLDRIVLGKGSADPFSPKVVRASAGSIFRVRVIQEEELSAFLLRERAQGRQIYAAVIGGQLSPEELPKKGLRGLVVGHEKRGVSPSVISCCAGTVSIPNLGRAESLNLTVAAGILLYFLSGMPR